MAMNLNLGAGLRYFPDYINHDITKHHDHIDIVYDLNHTPWTCWSDNQFDMIQAVSVFEHLEINIFQAMNECWRILKPTGKIYIKYPTFESPTIHDDPTHRWFWSKNILDYFDPTTEYGKRYAFYSERKWTIIDYNHIKNRAVGAELRPIKG